MNKRSKLIWGFLSFIGFALAVHGYMNTFIFKSGLSWSKPKTNNAISQSFGGYQRYTKDAKINAESDNSKSYKDFETIVQNLESAFYQRKNKEFIILKDPMNPDNIMLGSSQNSKAGYECNSIVEMPSGVQVLCEFEGKKDFLKINETIGNATLTEVNNDIVVLELKNKDRTRLEFKIKKY
tara:strand:+ start:276 stop:818 length:543 start_codon:yes stop_codon:yes gene_type:complete